MKKKRKKKDSRRERLLGRRLPPLPPSTSVLLTFCVEVLGRDVDDSSAAKRFSFSLSSVNRMPTTCTFNLALLHESSPVRVDILAHSCCDLEVHVEELQQLGLGRWGRGRESHPPFRRRSPFLQVSPLIPHRQGFRAH